MGTLLVYGVLVATHLGEFWPFSIYPMFSQGGQPWSRAVVRDVTDDPEAPGWNPLSISELPGRPYPLLEHGVDYNDLANFVSKTETWDAERLRAIERMFYDQRASRELLILRVSGRLDEADSVRIEFVPYVYLRPDSVLLNPALRPDSLRSVYVQP